MSEDEWLAEVVEPKLGARKWSPDWQAWLHQVFVSRGAVSVPDLLHLATAAQQQAAETASQRVAADVVRTTGQVVAIEPTVWDDIMRITCDGEFSNDDSGLFAIEDEEAACKVAETVQDILQERWWKVWPTCTAHGSGLHVDLINGEAVWLCRRGRHYSPIGQLDDEPGRP